MQQQKQWEEPGSCKVQAHEYFVSKHPGEDRDTDSEDDEETQKKIDNSKQIPVPIQDEPIDDTAQRIPIETEEPEPEAMEENEDSAENRRADDDPMGENEQ